MSYLDDMFGLRGKVAAVVGGGGVLAGCMAEGLAKAGADIAILDLNFESAKERASIISSMGVKTLAVKLDASKKSEFEKALKDIEKAFNRL
ncbi:SDR family NAD(P)-dependent oxidoreductase, partial [candidate division KSB1 bacterium]|nr:SDR family NAD(P)-dependent oxidoreductase [candidate division KSB1 bacterium]